MTARTDAERKERMMTQDDADDLLAIAEMMTNLARCPGGRIVNRNGHVCYHCGADLSINERCLSPRKGFKRAAAKAAA